MHIFKKTDISAVALTEKSRPLIERRLASVGHRFGVDPGIGMDELVRAAGWAERIMTKSGISAPARVGATISVADTLKAGEARRACVRATLTRKAGGVWALTGALVGHAYRPDDERRTWRVHVTQRAVAGIPSAVLHPLLSVS